MAMDALKNITSNVPEWMQRLGELNGQIRQRQAELAAVGQSTTKSLRNRGSNESLLRKDEDEAATPTSPNPDKGTADEPAENPVDPEAIQQPDGQQIPKASGDPVATSQELKQQTKQVMTVAQARARAQVRKRHRSQSIVSVEGHPAAYRSRSMIIVYYDSYVESFFEDLVKFVSASRNLMRKAKMAAKVAQIKRMAEMDNLGDDDDDDDDDAMPSRPLPSLRYLTASRSAALSPSLARMSGLRGAGLGDPTGGFYDKLDKGLEYVQSMCERAAHQFLRDGDCTEEVNNISTRLAETKELAEKESERILREEPDLAKESTETQKVRTHRPPAVRRDLNSAKDLPAGGVARDVKDGEKAGEKAPAVAPGAIVQTMWCEQILEADDDDEGFDDMEYVPPPRPTRRTARTKALEVDAEGESPRASTAA